jgi:hypothetical protein
LILYDISIGHFDAAIFRKGDLKQSYEFLNNHNLQLILPEAITSLIELPLLQLTVSIAMEVALLSVVVRQDFYLIMKPEFCL